MSVALFCFLTRPRKFRGCCAHALLFRIIRPIHNDASMKVIEASGRKCCELDSPAFLCPIDGFR